VFNSQRAVAAILVLTCLPALVLAAGRDIQLERKTSAGRETAIRGFAEFDSSCRLRNVPRVNAVQPPEHGTLETRPGVVTVGANWVGDTHCEGTKLDGMFLYYKPADGYVGADRFVFEVDYMRGGRVRATVDIDVAPAR
jgi:hypothetical protein